MAQRGRRGGATAPGGGPSRGAVPWNARDHDPRDLLALSVKIKAPADGARVNYTLNGHSVEYHVGDQWISQMQFNLLVEAHNLASLKAKIFGRIPADDRRITAIRDAVDVNAVKAAVGGEAAWRTLFPND